MHKWLQLPATPTDDPLATVYPVNHRYKKSHVYAVTRINPIYVDDERHGTWNKSGSSGYESQPHSVHSSLDKRSPPAAKYLRNGTATTPSSPVSDGSSGGSSGGGSAVQRNATVPWLSPIKEGVIDVHHFCIPRPVWPGRGDGHHRKMVTASHTVAGPEHAPRTECCRRCSRCRNRSTGSGSTTSSSSNSSTAGSNCPGGNAVAPTSCYSNYTSSAYGGSGTGTVSTGTCSDEAVPSSGTASVKSGRSPLCFDDVLAIGQCSPPVHDDWNPVDLKLNPKTDNLQHYDCGAMLRGLQFTLDAQQAEKLMQKIKVGKKHRFWCRLVTACLGLIMFLVSVVIVSLALTRGQKMFGSL